MGLAERSLQSEDGRTADTAGMGGWVYLGMNGVSVK